MFKKIIFTLTFIFCNLASHVQSQVEVQIESQAKIKKEKSILEELSELRIKNIHEILAVKKRDFSVKYSNSDLQALRVQLEDISKSPLFTARILKNTSIYDVKTNKKHYLTKDVNVRVHTLDDYDKFLYIINKSGELAYRVDHNSVVNIEQITDLYHKPHKFTPIKQQKKLKIEDDQFKYSMHINFHGGFNFPRYTKEVLVDPQGLSTHLKTEVGLITNHSFLFDYGLTTAYEAVKGDLSDGTYSIKTLSLGPEIKTRPFFYNTKFTLGSRISLISDVLETRSSGSKVHKLSELTLSLGAEREIQFKEIGTLIWGVNFQRKWLRAKVQNEVFNISSSDNYDESIALYIGHQSDWTW